MKRLLATILAISMCIGLCACGNDTSKDEVEEKKSKNEAEVWVLTGLNLPDIDVSFDFNVEYDDNNYATKMEISNIYATTKAEYVYNDQGLATTCYYNHDGSVSSEYYTYDKYGNQIDTDNDYVYHENGTIDFVMVDGGSTVIGYTYDDNGNLLSTQTQTQSGNGWTTYYTYTSSGKLESETGYISEEDVLNDNPWTRYVYEYDANGVVCKVICEYYMQSYIGTVYEPVYEKISVPKDDVSIIEKQQKFILDELLYITA